MEAGNWLAIREGMLQMPGSGARQLDAEVKPMDTMTAKNLIDRAGNRESRRDAVLRPQPFQPPGADPHAGWCGRGAAFGPPPMPIMAPRPRPVRRTAVRTVLAKPAQRVFRSASVYTGASFVAAHRVKPSSTVHGAAASAGAICAARTNPSA